MGIDKGFNHNPTNNNSDIRKSTGPQLNPSKAEKLPSTKENNSKKPSSDDDSGPNIAYSVFSLNPQSFVSDSDNLQVTLSKSGDRSGPGNLPGKSVTYDFDAMTDADFDDFDDNSFTV